MAKVLTAEWRRAFPVSVGFLTNLNSSCVSVGSWLGVSGLPSCYSPFLNYHNDTITHQLPRRHSRGVSVPQQGCFGSHRASDLGHVPGHQHTRRSCWPAYQPFSKEVTQHTSIKHHEVILKYQCIAYWKTTLFPPIPFISPPLNTLPYTSSYPLLCSCRGLAHHDLHNANSNWTTLSHNPRVPWRHSSSTVRWHRSRSSADATTCWANDLRSTSREDCRRPTGSPRAICCRRVPTVSNSRDVQGQLRGWQYNHVSRVLSYQRVCRWREQVHGV